WRRCRACRGRWRATSTRSSTRPGTEPVLHTPIRRGRHNGHMSVSRPRGLGDRLRSAARTLELTPTQADYRGSALTDLVVITGFSGAGKSTAMAAFEDEGYFCVDNLPPEMIRALAELFMHEGSKVERAAVVSDARGGSYFAGLVAVL